MACALALLLAASAVTLAAAAAPGVPTTEYVAVGGHNRSYELQIPSGSLADRSLPVILSFHGDDGTASEQAYSDHFRDVAGPIAIVVHGQGIGTEQISGKHHPTWNGGGSSMQSVGRTPTRIAPGGETCQQNITKGTLMVSCAKEIGYPGTASDPCWWSNCFDDVAYVVAILDQLQARFPQIDQTQIFGSGDSNGAMFLYQLIADPRTGHRLAAIAPVAGLPHNGFLFQPANKALRYINVWGTADTYIPAVCPGGDPSAKSGPGCCGWYYSCIGNTTALFAAAHGFPATTKPRPLAAPLAGNAAKCQGYSKLSGVISTALVVDCSWEGPHGWPHDGSTLRDGPALSDGSTRRQSARWPAEMILDFFLEGKAPPAPPPPPAPACADCGGKNCDQLIASNPEKYTCAELKHDWNCDCHGCKSCPNVTAGIV